MEELNLKYITIDGRKIGEEYPVFIIAEISANHNGSKERALELIRAAKKVGADAVKFQTYTADTITLKSNKPSFIARGLWSGRTLYDLYSEAYTPWEWHKEMFDEAKKAGLIAFSSPFDLTAVDFLEELNVPAYKIASYEINDIPLIKAAAKKQKPMIISTGIARLRDIELAVEACREVGNEQILLLKCVSSYPAPMEGTNLRIIPNMKETFQTAVGLSDHTFGATVPLGAVALGACAIEKHFTFKRSDGGADSGFSMEEEEFKDMVLQVRNLEKALGTADYRLSEKQMEERKSSRSLFVYKSVKRGERLSPQNIRSVRPADGLPPKYYDEVLGKTFTRDIEEGTPLSFDMIGE